MFLTGQRVTSLKSLMLLLLFRMLSVIFSTVIIFMTRSSKRSGLGFVGAGVSCINFGTCVVEQRSSGLALCGVLIEQGVGRDIILVTWYRYTCQGVNQTAR